MSVHVINICSKFRSNSSSKWGDTALHETGVNRWTMNRQTAGGRPKNTMPLPCIVGGGKITWKHCYPVTYFANDFFVEPASRNGSAWLYNNLAAEQQTQPMDMLPNQYLPLMKVPGVKLSQIPPDLRSGTSSLGSGTLTPRSRTLVFRSGT